ncbi:MAG: hypothetical protein ACE5F6_00230 [Anaerolineae bacterium]
MDIRIGNHGWTQVGGDMNPGTYGGTIAKADGSSIELLKIQPVREYVGDREAVEVGYPFWTQEGYFTIDDLSLDNGYVKSALSFWGYDTDANRERFLYELKPESRAMVIAEALLDYGRGDEGPSGWAQDIIPAGERVNWWGIKRPKGWRYLEDEDKEFRQLLRENS